jgi:hypothetical protein
MSAPQSEGFAGHEWEADRFSTVARWVSLGLGEESTRVASLRFAGTPSLALQCPT